MKVVTTFASAVSIPETQRNQIIDILNARLADALDLKSQTKQAHWNIKGPNFIALHELFDKIAEHIDEHVDEVAERITALGGVAYGTVRVAASTSTLDEYDLQATTGEQHLVALVKRVAKFTNLVRADIDRTDSLGDAVTADLLTGIARESDKDLWFLEAHLQG